MTVDSINKQVDQLFDYILTFEEYILYVQSFIKELGIIRSNFALNEIEKKKAFTTQLYSFKKKCELLYKMVCLYEWELTIEKINQINKVYDVTKLLLKKDFDSAAVELKCAKFRQEKNAVSGYSDFLFKSQHSLSFEFGKLGLRSSNSLNEVHSYVKETTKVNELFHLIKNQLNRSEFITSEVNRFDKSLQIALSKGDQKQTKLLESQMKKLTSGFLDLEPEKKEKCYIATMVYEDYNHPKVIVLRRFRDDVISNYYIGRIAIQFYYALSPTFVRVFEENHKVKYIITLFLNRLITHISKEDIKT